jgi:anthranilate phosphoribosyltransferase
VSLAAPTRLYELRDGAVAESTVRAAELGLAAHGAEALRGGSPEENAAAVRRVLEGEPGPEREFTLANAAAALVAADLAPDLRVGLDLATNAIDSGAARERLEAWLRISNEVS